MTGNFGDRLTRAIQERGPLCLGIDPHPARIPSLFGRPGLEGIRAFGRAVVERAAGRVAAIKPQIALFEQWGPAGFQILADLTFYARDAGLIVLLDAKRGDIASTAQAYAQAYLGDHAWLHADAATVNPYMGEDSLVPWLDVAEKCGKGVIALVRTSNAGARDLQVRDSDGAPLWCATAQLVAKASEPLIGQSSWSSVMAVVGATAPAEAKRARELMPHTPFLVPGYGAQGASAADAMAGAVVGASGPEGVIVNASRSVLFGVDDDGMAQSQWDTAFDERLSKFAQDLCAGSALSQ